MNKDFSKQQEIIINNCIAKILKIFAKNGINAFNVKVGDQQVMGRYLCEHLVPPYAEFEEELFKEGHSH